MHGRGRMVLPIQIEVTASSTSPYARKPTSRIVSMRVRLARRLAERDAMFVDSIPF